jgi:tRNA(fMet)-specific endonuclease VapC
MADRKLMVDSSILIDYFRKTNKENSRLVTHFRQFDRPYISVVTEFEVLNGATQAHKEFWNGMLARLTVLDFDRPAAREAVEIVEHLNPKHKSIDKPDLFIAATARLHSLSLDTFNMKQFADIDGLNLWKTP